MKHFPLVRRVALLLTVVWLLPTLLACGNGERSTTADTFSATTISTSSATTKETCSEGLSTEDSKTTESNSSENLYDPTEYDIFYELDGGVDPHNPDVYTAGDEIRLAIPLRSGYSFLGWEGTDLSAPTQLVTIPKGSTGDREYTARWEARSTEDDSPKDPEQWLDPTHFGEDDGVDAAPKATVPSTSNIVGYRGEAVYAANTVYTDFTVDGVMENAYTHGVRWKTTVSDSGRHTETGTYYMAYLVRGQDGKAHVFVEVHDRDIVINDELWDAHYYRCDSIHVYYEYGNAGTGHSMWTFAAEPTRKYTKLHPEEWKVVMTDVGYNVEFAFDNNGRPFMEGDELGISIFLNDCYDYVNLSSYKKDNIKTSTRLNPVSEGYRSPDAAIADSLRFSLASATGNVTVDVSDGAVEKTGEMMTDILSGAATVGVILGADASPHTESMAKNIFHQLRYYNAKATFVRERRGVAAAFDYEICFGYTERDATERILEDFSYNEYGFAVYDNRIAVFGVIESSLDRATALLTDVFEYAKEGIPAAYLGTCYSEPRSILPGEYIPKLEGVELITDAGDNSYHLMKLNATKAMFDAYCAALEEAGFALYTTNLLGTVSAATYHDAVSVVNVTYDSSNKRELRVVIDPKSMTNLPPLEAEAYTKVNDSTVTMLSPNNLTVIFRLDNGEFLIVDSGTNHQPSYIYQELMRQTEGEHAIIAAWIFTHFHQDHNGGFVSFVQNSAYMKNVTIKALIYNNPHQQVIDLASPLDRDNMSKWPTLIHSTGADLYQARTGQQYVFANTEIEFLFTYEDLMPFWIKYDRSNPTSMVFTVTVDGQKFMMTGDASREGLQNCVDRYGEELKSDFVQLSHHGHGDGGSPVEFYQLVDADVVYLPGSSTATAEKWACDNAKKVYVCAEDGTVTIPVSFAGVF